VKTKGVKPNANEAQLREAARKGMDKTMVFCLTALADKHGFEKEDLKQFVAEVANIADGVRKRYVSYDDLYRALAEESGIRW